MDELKNSCPVCGAQVNANTSTCPMCGYRFQDTTQAFKMVPVESDIDPDVPEIQNVAT